MAKTVPQLGDVITSPRFQYGMFEEYREIMIVGWSSNDAESDLPTRATAAYLVVYVRGSAPNGTPTGGSYEVWAARLKGRNLGDLIMFECKAVCHEKISPNEIEKVDHHELAPLDANAKLVLKAADAAEAASIARSLLGFVPTKEPVQEGANWTVLGYSFRPMKDKPESVIGVASLLVA